MRKLVKTTHFEIQEPLAKHAADKDKGGHQGAIDKVMRVGHAVEGRQQHRFDKRQKECVVQKDTQ